MEAGVILFSSCYGALYAYQILSDAATPLTSYGKWFLPTVIVSIFFGMLVALTVASYRKWKWFVLFLVLASLWWFQVVHVLRYPPDYGYVNPTTMSVSAYYITSPKGTCRQCLFASYDHIFNYTVMMSPQAKTFQELSTINGLDTSHFKGEWEQKGILSFFITMNRIFKKEQALPTAKDWILVYEDDAQFMPEFNTRIASYMKNSLENNYDVLFLDTRCSFADLFLHTKGEASVGVAYNPKRINDLARLSFPESDEIKEHLKNGGRGAVTHLIATLCNKGFFKCRCAPFVREVPGLKTTLDGPP